MAPAANTKPHIVIVGGGFGGVYTAMYLEKLLRSGDADITLISSENYFVFQPLLAEVVSGNIGLLDTVNPLHRLLRRTTVLIREVVSIDLQQRTVTLRPGFRPRHQVLDYDHLVLAVGTVTDFRNTPGLREHALGFKTLADAIRLRNHLIHVLEECNIEEDPQLRRQLLTFVVSGGGFSGVEVAAELNDFVRRAARYQRRIKAEEISVILVHSGQRVLEREMSEDLGLYAQKIMEKRGIKLRLKTRLKTATRDAAVLETGELIPSRTVVATVPSNANPLIERLDIPKHNGRVKVDGQLRVEGQFDIWSLGDCATISTPDGKGVYPPTAQHAIREAHVVAKNIVATMRKRPLERFDFPGLGKMGSVGHRTAVVELFGRIKLSGFFAWWVWRTLYWLKLPGLDRKLKVAIGWTLDLLFPPETVQLKVQGPSNVSQMHFEAGQIVFEQGDLGDAVYIILSGGIEVLIDGRPVARMKAGEFFGEMALLQKQTRTATIRCAAPTDLLVLDQSAFKALTENLPHLKESFEHVMHERIAKNTTASAEEIVAGVAPAATTATSNCPT